MFDYATYMRNVYGRRAVIPATETAFFEGVIERWKGSQGRREQLDGYRYHEGAHDILWRQRMVLGKGGRLEASKNLPNNRIVDNQYWIMHALKVNYLLGKPFTLRSKNNKYIAFLNGIFDAGFLELLNQIGGDALNGGVGWMYVFCEDNQLKFKRFLPYEIVPLWKDSERTALEAAVRVHRMDSFAKEEEAIERVEVYTKDGVRFYYLENGKLEEDKERPPESYLLIEKEDGSSEHYNWNKIPVIAFRYNDLEKPLLSRVKTQQDAINMIHSEYRNSMEKNAGGGSGMVVKNYSGTSPEEFVERWAAYQLAFVDVTQEMPGGGVDVLKIEITPENYETELRMKKISLIENAMGVDVKEIRSNAPNRMNIESMYVNMELDAESMERKFSKALKELLWFLNVHTVNTGGPDYTAETVEIEFNRDLLMNEAEIIDGLNKSSDCMSLQSRVEMHPYVRDPAEEMRRLEKEQKDRQDIYNGAFKGHRQSAQEENQAES